MELEFRAVTERLEPENLKPLQFEQCINSSGQWSVAREPGDPLLAAFARGGDFRTKADCLPGGFLFRRI